MVLETLVSLPARLVAREYFLVHLISLKASDHTGNLIFEVLTAMRMVMVVFWALAPCRLVRYED
jgi:hypothetical protein